MRYYGALSRVAQQGELLGEQDSGQHPLESDATGLFGGRVVLQEPRLMSRSRKENRCGAAGW